jgi:hypothetical protein
MGTFLEKLLMHERLATGRATGRNDANQVSVHVHDHNENDTSCDRADANEPLLIEGVLDIEDLGGPVGSRPRRRAAAVRATAIAVAADALRR